MNGQEAFRKLANQLKNAGGSGSPLPGAPKGLFAGSGLLITLIAGGFALNASLFNGKYLRGLCDLQLGLIVENSRWRPSCHQVHPVSNVHMIAVLTIYRMLQQFTRRKGRSIQRRDAFGGGYEFQLLN